MLETTSPSEEAPAVLALRTLEVRALRIGASDIHIEPRPQGGLVRLRIDGLLRELQSIETAVFWPLVSRVKLLAGMDIADKRQPQDGRYTIDAGDRRVDARVSSVPTIHGEKLVVRLLDAHVTSPGLEELGMHAATLTRYRRLIESPYGFLIVTGPTGSGKTTTLYSSLRHIADKTRSICTVEDPVEMYIDGVTQVNVNVRAGLTFAVVLRAFLRQDPNVIMVGEMRDPETASVAVAAALSGQLVVTTLHSNDAPGAIERLMELGLGRRAIAAAVFGIASQRLVRRLCVSCRRRVLSATAPEYVAVGCGVCNGTGFCGRIGVFELLEFDDAVREEISSGASAVSIRAVGKQTGYEPLLTDGLAKVVDGQTTMQELRRVLTWST